LAERLEFHILIFFEVIPVIASSDILEAKHEDTVGRITSHTWEVSVFDLPGVYVDSLSDVLFQPREIMRAGIRPVILEPVAKPFSQQVQSHDVILLRQFAHSTPANAQPGPVFRVLLPRETRLLSKPDRLGSIFFCSSSTFANHPVE